MHEKKYKLNLSMYEVAIIDCALGVYKEHLEALDGEKTMVRKQAEKATKQLLSEIKEVTKEGK